MPTILLQAGFRFHFFSGDDHEPPHIHVDGDGTRAKIWLRDLTFAKRGDFNQAQQKRIVAIVQANRQMMVEAWDEFFG